MDLQKKAFITAIISDGTRRMDIPAVHNKIPGWDYILFTNVKDLLQNGNGWYPRPVKQFNKTAVYTVKYCRRMTHELLPEYHTVVWLDGYLSPSPGMDWSFFDKYDNFALKPYPSKRNCVYKELQAIIDLKKDTKKRIHRLRAFLEEEGMPVDYGLYETNIFARTLQNHRVNYLFEKLYEMIQEYTYRDQALLPYVLWKTGTFPDTVFSNGWIRKKRH